MGIDYDAKAKKVIGNHPLEGNVLPVMSFGDDADGEVYFTTDHGTIHRFQALKKAAPVQVTFRRDFPAILRTSMAMSRAVH